MEDELYAFPHKKVLCYKTSTTGMSGDINAPTFAEPVFTETEGMTLRDYFAAKAMQGMLAAGANWHDMYKLYQYTDTVNGIEEHEPEVNICYKIADAMIKARESTKEEGKLNHE